MLSLCRSIVRTRSVVSAAALNSRRNLAVTTKICTQDLTVSDLTTTDNRKDLLVSSVRFSNSTEQLGTVIEQYEDILSAPSLVHVMLRYCALYEEQKTGVSAIDDPVFQRLSRTVLSRIRFFRAQDCVRLASAASRMELDASCSLVQGIFQMLRKRLNELTLDQIMMLRRCIDGLQGRSVLTETVRISLSLVFETQVERQLDPQDKQMCLKALRFVLSVESSPAARKYVAQACLPYLRELSPRAAASLIWGAAFQEGNQRSLQVRETNFILKQCLDIVARNLSQFDDKSIRRTLGALQKLEVSSRELFDALWALAPTWSLNEVNTLAYTASISDAILKGDAEVLRDFLLIHRTEVANADPSFVANFAEVMSLLAVQSFDHDSRLTEIGNSFATAIERGDRSNLSRYRYVSLILHLATLDVFPKQELDRLFSVEYQESIVSNLEFSIMERLQDLERLLQLRFGDECPYRVLPELRQTSSKVRPTFVAGDLLKAVEAAVGGNEFVLRRMMTPLGVDADLAVVMREGEHPIALTDKQFPFEGLPPNCKVVGILQAVYKRDFTSAGDCLRVPFALKQHFLRAQDICPVTIRMSDWTLQPENEKISYIMTKIKEALRESHT